MSILINNLNNEHTNEVPVWLMRQAGRYMKEYHKVKKEFDNFLSMCKDPEAVTEITLQPIDKFDLDSAIIFSDILIVLECINLKVNFIPGKGPVVESKNILKKLNKLSFNKNLGELEEVYTAIKRVKKILERKKKPLIGFCGAPWTLATYILEGSISKDYLKIKKFAYEHKNIMDKLIKTLCHLTIEHLSKQIDAGVDAIQIFESHSRSMDYYSCDRYMTNSIKMISSEIKARHPKTPIIFFSKSNTYLRDKNLLNYLDCISFSSEFRMIDSIEVMSKNMCLQGNLDPVSLLVGGTHMKSMTSKILEDMRERSFIFNLGHGVLPNTPVDNVYRLVEQIKSFKK